ncbi:MAG: tetratricopeptide repeat protein, partial [Pirellulales bacterium]|nr:tetratricopeptide repeat protein [Pirellulales bacterium]
NLAISDLSRSKSFKPGGFGYSHRVSLANTLLEVGREEEAIAELRSIIDEKPEQTVVAEALLSVYQSATPPRYAEAENLIYTYMRRNPKSDRWPFFIGQLGEQVGDWNKAIEGYRKAAELSHYNPGTVSALLRAYKRANQPRDIIRCVTEKLSTRLMNTMPNALAALAWSYVKVGEQNKGLQAYDQALAVAGGDFSSFATIVGEMVSVFGKEVALERAQSRAKNDPGNVDNKKGLVHLLFINGEQEAALETCREVAELAVRDEDIVFAELGQAMLLGALDRHEEAKAKYEVVLKLNPRQPLALNNLAYLLSEKMHNPAEALPYAEQAKRANPNGTDVLDTLGWVLFQNGRDGEAVGMLLRALEIDRDNFAASYHLGVVHKSRGELEEARFRLEEALDVAKKAEGGQRYLPKIEKALKELEDVGR